MSKEYEVVSTTVVADTVIADAMLKSIGKKFDAAITSTDALQCEGCVVASLCALAANELGSPDSVSFRDSSILADHGINITSDGICAKELVMTAISRNESNDFWILNADELTGKSVEIRSAQTVINALKDIRQKLQNGAIK